MLKRSKDGRTAHGWYLDGSNDRKEASKDVSFKADASGEPLSQKVSAEAPHASDKDFQVWLKRLQDSYEERIQPKLAEIASLRQELMSTKSELSELKLLKANASFKGPSMAASHGTEIETLKT